jgi:flagellar biosynthesis/type III secretory pathway protein FliH
VAPARLRRIAAEEARAREVAKELVARARAEAAAITVEARAAAEAHATSAAAEARAVEEARGAALYLRIKQEDEHRAERDLDRSIALAVVLAERLIGAALEHEPELVIQLARQALAEARGARRATIDASPLDAEPLRRHLVDAGFDSHAVDIRSDPAMPRGSLRISTNLGTLDARLSPQLERLAAALRDPLRAR